jgi:hypothetical protein
MQVLRLMDFFGNMWGRRRLLAHQAKAGIPQRGLRRPIFHPNFLLHRHVPRRYIIKYLVPVSLI